jgi:Ser/Thr protein kinase RdoA (MazF antagonist)
MDGDQTPRRGQLRRLARAALGQQGIRVRRLRRMPRHSNHLFRADATDGQRLVVRVCLPGGRSDAELDAELAWLVALARDTGLAVPVPRFSTRAASPEFPAGARCIGFSWVHGRPCGPRPSRALVTDLGRVIGTLHTHAAGFRPPPGFTRPSLDVTRLSWAGTRHAAQLASRPIDPQVRALLGQATQRAGQVLTGLGQDPAGYGLVHADLDLDNVLDYHGQARVIDFDDASWGHYALDLAIAADGIPEALRPALLAGYQTVHPLPPGYVRNENMLLAGRRLYLAIWHLANGLPADAHLKVLAALISS